MSVESCMYILLRMVILVCIIRKVSASFQHPTLQTFCYRTVHQARLIPTTAASKAINEVAVPERMAELEGIGVLALPELPALLGLVAVAVGAGPPVMSEAPPVMGPGGADAEAPTPTRAPSACCRENDNMNIAIKIERKTDVHQVLP